jgi:hypothetical protein
MMVCRPPPQPGFASREKEPGTWCTAPFPAHRERAGEGALP